MMISFSSVVEAVLTMCILQPAKSMSGVMSVKLTLVPFANETCRTGGTGSANIADIECRRHDQRLVVCHVAVVRARARGVVAIRRCVPAVDLCAAQQAQDGELEISRVDRDSGTDVVLALGSLAGLVVRAAVEHVVRVGGDKKRFSPSVELAPFLTW